MQLLFEILFIIAGIICIVLGIDRESVVLIVTGIFLLAIGGVWMIWIDTDNGVDLFD